jgi:hypothetical protein
MERAEKPKKEAENRREGVAHRYFQCIKFDPWLI